MLKCCCSTNPINLELKQKLEDANKLMEREVEKINKEVIKKIKSDYEEKIKELNETVFSYYFPFKVYNWLLDRETSK